MLKILFLIVLCYWGCLLHMHSLMFNILGKELHVCWRFKASGKWKHSETVSYSGRHKSPSSPLWQPQILQYVFCKLCYMFSKMYHYLRFEFSQWWVWQLFFSCGSDVGLPWRKKRQILLKCSHLCAKIHSIRPHNTMKFIQLSAFSDTCIRVPWCGGWLGHLRSGLGMQYGRWRWVYSAVWKWVR